MTGALMTISSSTVSGVLMAIILLKATDPFYDAYRSIKEIMCERDLSVCIICFVYFAVSLSCGNNMTVRTLSALRGP